MYYVYVKSFCQVWIFEDFCGGTLAEAENCAAIMNNGNAASDHGWRYFVSK